MQQFGEALLRKRGRNYSNRIGTSQHVGVAQSRKNEDRNIAALRLEFHLDRGVFGRDDVGEPALSIWAHAHGLKTLYLSGRITVPRASFRRLYMRSLDRLLNGLRNNKTITQVTGTDP